MSDLVTAIKTVVEKKDLKIASAKAAFHQIMEGKATDAQIAAFIVALRMKGETALEIAAAAEVLREKSEKIKAPATAIDTCGTGGDAKGSLNISTAVAFVVAACGVPVAKHGNKAVSSTSGSADVLRELGVNVDAEIAVMEQALNEIGVCFMFAPKYHIAMRHVAKVRQELGLRTIFNLLGPLINPAGAKYQLLGVYDKAYLEPLAMTLKQLGSNSAWIVHGADGMDEITTTDITHVVSLNEGKIKNFTIDPADYEIAKVKADALLGGDAKHNAVELKKVLSDSRANTAYRDIILLNSAASLVIAKKAEDLVSGIAMAKSAIASGAAKIKLDELIKITNC